MDIHALAWAAGFFDGEGCVATQVRQRKHRRDYSVSLYVGQVDLAIQLRERITSYGRFGVAVEQAETDARMALLSAIKSAKWRSYGEEVMPGV